MKKLVHTADWHLGARLYGQDRIDEQRRFLDWFAALLERERPDVLLVAGDVFDTYSPPVSAEDLYFGFLGRIARSGCVRSAVLVGGNHDSPSKLAASREVLERLDIHVVASPRPDPADEVFAVPCADGGTLVVGAVPFLRESDIRNAAPDAPEAGRLAAGFAAHYAAVAAVARERFPGAPLVLTGHGTLSGASFSDDRSERSRSVIGGLESVGTDGIPVSAAYAAFGHLHIAQTLRGNIRYAGSPFPMSFGEVARAPSVTVCELDEGKAASLREISVPSFRRLVALCGSAAEVEAELRELAASTAGGEVWVEVALTGGGSDQGSFGNRLDELLAGTSVSVLACHNRRETSLGAAFTRPDPVDLRTLDPAGLALQFFRENGLDESEQACYMALFREAEAARDRL